MSIESMALWNITSHYANSSLVASIREGLIRLGKTETTVTAEDLAPVDEFHIGGRASTSALARQLELTGMDHVLDVGCGLGGAARQIVSQYSCRVTGIDLTQDYVDTGNILSGWLRLGDRVRLEQGNALALPFADESFTAAYMLHVGMNIADKQALFAGLARVLRAGGHIGVYDVMRTGEGEFTYPLPWAANAEANAIAEPQEYREALTSAGFAILSERECRDVAVAYFERQRAQVAAAGGPPPLGVHTLMGARRPELVRNMLANIEAGRIAPVEIIARKVH